MLPQFKEYYLIEAVDLDRTWAVHRDKVIVRATYDKDSHIIAKGLSYIGAGEHFNDPGYEKAAAGHFMDEVKNAMPHPKYIPTAVKMYADGGIKRIEDISTQAAEVFGKYHKLATHGKLDPKLSIHPPKMEEDAYGIDRNAPDETKKPVPHTDFKRMSFSMLRAVTNHPDYADFLREPPKKAKKGDYTVVHDDDEVSVYHPHTHEASVALAHCPHTGQKASWCTAANSGAGKSYFNDYNREGPLLIYHPKNPRHDGEMYQSHIPSDQHMDENDEPAHYGTTRGGKNVGYFDYFHDTDDDGNQLSDKRHYIGARFPGFTHDHAVAYHEKAQAMFHPDDEDDDEYHHHHEELISFSELLLEAVDLDRTWEAHKDAILKRVQEADHYHVYQPDHNGNRQKTGQISAQMYHNTMAARRGDKAMGRTSNDNRAFVPIYRDHHLAAATLQQSIKFADEDYARGKQIFMDMVKEAAPHPKYIPTIVKMYANGSIKKMEDIETQASEAFGKYHKLATHGRLDPNKHVIDTATGNVAVHSPESLGGQEAWDNNLRVSKMINPMGRKPIQETNFKAFNSMKDVKAVVDHPDHKKFFAGEMKAALKGQYTVVHDDDDVTVYHPHTWEASKSLAVCPHSGKKAAWCTAADSATGKSYFEKYSKQGALLIYHPKNPEHDGEMYQTHHASEQFMDENDDEHPFYHLTSKTPGVGLVKAEHEDYDGRPRGRFPGFNSSSAIAYTNKHMYEHPEQYSRDAHKGVGDYLLHAQGLRAANSLKDSFSEYFKSRDPANQDGHWRPITADEAKASREEAERTGKQYFPATQTVKDRAAYDAARAHHAKVHAHFWGHADEHDRDEDEDEWR